jgi:hypothetical protein
MTVRSYIKLNDDRKDLASVVNYVRKLRPNLKRNLRSYKTFTVQATGPNVRKHSMAIIYQYS